MGSITNAKVIESCVAAEGPEIRVRAGVLVDGESLPALKMERIDDGWLMHSSNSTPLKGHGDPVWIPEYIVPSGRLRESI
jgi:hypothetical protein